MIHHYKAIYTRKDGSVLIHEKQIDGISVALESHSTRRGDRLDFLELINRWNRIGSGENLTGLKSQYIAGESVHG